MQVPGNYNPRDTGGEMLSTSCAHFYGPFFDPKWLEPNFALQLCTFITNEDTWNNKCQASKRGSPVGKAVLVLCPGSRRNHCPTSQKLEPALLVGSDRDATEGLLTVGENREWMLPPKSLQWDFLEVVFGIRSNPAFQQRPRRSSGKDRTTVRRGLIPHKLQERICHRKAREDSEVCFLLTGEMQFDFFLHEIVFQSLVLKSFIKSGRWRHS